MEECKKYNEKELKEKLLNVKDLVIEYKNNEDTYREVIKLLRKYISFVEAYELRREIRKKLLKCLQYIFYLMF